jgi:hypothetical protein
MGWEEAGRKLGDDNMIDVSTIAFWWTHMTTRWRSSTFGNCERSILSTKINVEHGNFNDDKYDDPSYLTTARYNNVK